MDRVHNETDNVNEDRRDADDVIVISDSDESASLTSANKDDELSLSDSDSEFPDLAKQCPLHCLE